MNCCATLKQWIEDTDQSAFWKDQDALHFVSSNGKRIRVAAWPLPAPLHLSGLLFRWPQLAASRNLPTGDADVILKMVNLDASPGHTAPYRNTRASVPEER